ncbi:hypothetical protein [Pseudobutyrivibrio xylanivorans]|uniref:Uncharacterized protein n=1 Tax=Pseudobutyrivibrio xylanivorans DSM 14809 TaxID=1123012 RepID=A0A1M6FX46_PSEXY|nr:hypothetical protein [Pseudobutyrivibrio xylanivorans]SHJ02288.1 hypothetical protein SAMN02745725_01597 [Pseudobutyrivibrio xylanivorans DSM 14809]
MKLEKFKLNKKIFKQIIIKAATVSVGISLFTVVMDLITQHKFSLNDIVISCLQMFVILIILYVVAPWMRKAYGINTENEENT